MRRRGLLTLAAASVVACSSSTGPAEQTSSPADFTVRFETIALGLTAPVFVTAPVADPRLFIVEQPGRILVVDGGNLARRILY